jgi:hypothetical protein
LLSQGRTKILMEFCLILEPVCFYLHQPYPDTGLGLCSCKAIIALYREGCCHSPLEMWILWCQVAETDDCKTLGGLQTPKRSSEVWGLQLLAGG